MTDLESAAAALADGLAIDLPRLQPAGQVRFDPATLGVVVGLWLLKNVADGVAEAIKEGSKCGTESLAQRIGAAIRRRVRGDLPGAMDSGAEDRALDNAVVAAESAWDEAHSARDHRCPDRRSDRGGRGQCHRRLDRVRSAAGLGCPRGRGPAHRTPLPSR
ncbi:hypothetical protein [Nocardia ignorata]|uniref:hypothetical protein n=1 Tax=Nocardia ignorata TaxID=145285 RepID=UPI000A655921|nr:hypothetical protein [Nocardia ignorata]